MGNDDRVDATLDGTEPPTSHETPDTFDEISLQPFDWLTSAASIGSLIRPLLRPENANRILHVGCGSSVLGEWIVEECTSQISKVVNVDCDVDTLTRMQRRWRDRMALVDVIFELHVVSEDMMEFVEADFTIPNALSFMDATPFDIIVDKSTLDCMLCTDTGAIGLLTEVYRLLKEDSVYLVVSFHPPEFIRTLLAELPGADWEVTCSLVPRQIEELSGSVCHHTKEFSLSVDDSLRESIGSASTVTVLHCRRRHRRISDTGLDWDAVYQHVHSVNQKWYQQINPLITSDRIQQIERVFADAGEDLNLRQCYQVLFTDGERENLDYDDFVGDWMSYLVEQSTGCSELPVDRMSFATAVKFLQAMQ